MPRLLRRSAVLALVLFAVSATAEQQWVEVKSPHFSVITDGGAKRGAEIALRFEQMRSVFGMLFLKDKVNLPVPLQIIAFHSGKQYAAYSPKNTSGYFQPGEDRSFIVLDLSAEEKWQTVFHEYAHQLLNGNFPPTGAWFDEGFAEYFSTLRVTNKVVEIGAPPERSAVLSHYKIRPVTELFAVGHNSPTYHGGGADTQLFYAQSWVMVHYLFDRKKLPEAAAYFTLVQNGMAVPDAIRKAFKMEPQQLDKDVASYVDKQQVVMARLGLQVSVDPSTFTVAPLDALDARVALAELRIGSNDLSDKTAQEFEDILRLRPDLPAAQRGLGFFYFRRGLFDKAAEHLKRAAALNSKDPWVHYYTGLLLVRESMAAGRPPDDIAGLKKNLQTAIALDPGFADAYSLLSFADFVSGDVDAALADARKAADLSPRNETYALNLARAYLTAGKPLEAKAIFERLKDSPNQAISLPAQQGLARAERVADDQATAVRHQLPESYDKPQWHRDPQEIEREPEPPAAPQIDKRPVKYLRGELVSVDCSQPPAAALAIKSGPKSLKLLTTDSSKLLLIGADQFSCSWKNRKVLVNYKPGGKADGDLVSLELQ